MPTQYRIGGFVLCNDYSTFYHRLYQTKLKSHHCFFIILQLWHCDILQILQYYMHCTITCITILHALQYYMHYNITCNTILQMTSLEVLQVVKTRDLLVIREIIMMIMIWILGKNTHTLSRCRPDVLYVTYMYKRWHYTLPYERNFYVETFIKMQEFNLAMVTLWNEILENFPIAICPSCRVDHSVGAVTISPHSSSWLSLFIKIHVVIWLTETKTERGRRVMWEVRNHRRQTIMMRMRISEYGLHNKRADKQIIKKVCCLNKR